MPPIPERTEAAYYARMKELGDMNPPIRMTVAQQIAFVFHEEARAIFFAPPGQAWYFAFVSPRAGDLYVLISLADNGLRAVFGAGMSRNMIAGLIKLLTRVMNDGRVMQ